MLPVHEITTDTLDAVHDVRLPGRFLAQGVGERPCTLVSHYRGRLSVTTGKVGASASDGRVVVYLDLVGRIEGEAVWTSDDAFSLGIAAPPDKRVRLARQFAKLARLPPDGRDELRGQHRVKPDVDAVEVVRGTGERIRATLVDLSRSGAAIRSMTLPREYEDVTVGRTPARVVRRFEGGFAVAFRRLLPLETFEASYRL